MRMIVAIPTTGRRAIVGPTIRALSEQTRLPDQLIVVTAREGDVDPADLRSLPFPSRLERSELGLTRQRNRALDLVGADDVLLFLDDDFLMAPDYLGALEALFTSRPDVVMATGTVLRDGIIGPGIPFDQAVSTVRSAPPVQNPQVVPVYNGYGCNMAVRARAVIETALRFDVALPLYGWLEDVDFSRGLAPLGAIVRSEALRGVHLGTKTGRVSGLRLGYSQIANPLYLMSKGTMRASRAAAILSRNLVRNLIRALWPEPEVDRRGRLRGNLRAFADLMRGRLHPLRAADLE